VKGACHAEAAVVNIVLANERSPTVRARAA
jgi:hypothetical protein